jgi:hypothetical protein
VTIETLFLLWPRLSKVSALAQYMDTKYTCRSEWLLVNALSVSHYQCEESVILKDVLSELRRSSFIGRLLLPIW